jgi:hypothetical protein
VDVRRDPAPTGAFDQLARHQMREGAGDVPDRVSGSGLLGLPELLGVEDGELGVPSDTSSGGAGLPLALQAAVGRISTDLEGVVASRAELAAFSHPPLTSFPPSQRGKFVSGSR